MKFKTKTAHNPDGYEPFLTQKFVKKMILGQIFLIIDGQILLPLIFSKFFKKSIDKPTFPCYNTKAALREMPSNMPA